MPRVKALSRFVHKGAIFLTFMYRKEFYNQSFKCNFFNVSDTLIDLHYISRITGLQDDNRGYSVKYLSDNFVNEAGQCRSIIRTI